MALSLDHLNPLPKVAKFINFTDFDVVPIATQDPVYLPLQQGDRMHIAPPSEIYLIDSNNNAYRNVLPPPDGFNGKPTEIFSHQGSYNVYDGLKNAFITPIKSDGWKVDYFPPVNPNIDPNAKQQTSEENFWSTTQGMVVIFLILLIIVVLLLTISRSTNGGYESLSILHTDNLII
jgi:hypothetical protein